MNERVKIFEIEVELEITTTKKKTKKKTKKTFILVAREGKPEEEIIKKAIMIFKLKDDQKVKILNIKNLKTLGLWK